MEIIIHRGTHQIGGIATEIRTSKTTLNGALHQISKRFLFHQNHQMTYVSHPQKIDGVKTQTLKIIFDCIGEVNIPAENK